MSLSPGERHVLRLVVSGWKLHMFKSFGKNRGANSAGDAGDKERNRANAQAAKARDKIVALSKELENSKTMYTELLGKFNNVSSEHDDLETQLSDCRTELEETNEELEEARLTASTAEKARKKAESELQFANVMKDNALNGQNDLFKQIEDANKQLDSKKGELSNLAKALENEKASMERHNQKLRDEKLNNAKLTSLVDNLKLEIEQLNKRAADVAIATRLAEERRTMREADTCGYFERLLLRKQIEMVKLKCELNRSIELKHAQTRRMYEHKAKQNIQHHVELLTRRQHEVLVMLNDTRCLGRNEKRLRSSASEVEKINLMISRDKETLKAVKLNSKHVEDFVANAERNDIQAVYQALSEGVISVDSVDSAGYTALQCASKANNLKMCSLLVEKGGADIEVGVDNATPLILASRSGHIEVVKYLLSRGAELARRDIEGRTALMNASVNAHVSVVDVLLRPSQNLSLHKDRDGYTPVHLCCSTKENEGTAAERSRCVVLKKLLERGFDIEANDRGANTPLHVAASHGNIILAQILINHGCDIHAPNKLKLSPAGSARCNHQSRFSKWISGVMISIKERREHAEVKEEQIKWQKGKYHVIPES